MTRTFKRIIITAVLLIAVAAGACALVLSGGCSTQGITGSTEVGATLEQAKNGAVNTVLDITGVKQRIDTGMREQAGAIAEEMGVPQSVVNNIVDTLAIPDWQATTLPAGAEALGTYDVQTKDLSTQVTIYDDPSVVTLKLYGQDVTMAVPKSAQGYITLLQYLG